MWFLLQTEDTSVCYVACYKCALQTCAHRAFRELTTKLTAPAAGGSVGILTRLQTRRQRPADVGCAVHMANLGYWHLSTVGPMCAHCKE